MAHFDLDDPKLPDSIEEQAFQSGNYPYDNKLKKKKYEAHLEALQIELTKLQSHLQQSGERVILIFEGRDAAGKGGTIRRYTHYLNPRHNRVVALSKPTETEQGQWYFQRYVAHFPTAGEQVLFDRSWYNRAVVEPVMGFCTPEQTESFYQKLPDVEHMIVKEGIHFFKFWLNIGQEMQIKRFHERRHSPLKHWKLSPVDLRALGKWDDYSAARDEMLKRSDFEFAPWTVIRANDKRRARIGAIQSVVSAIDYAGRDMEAIGEMDKHIVQSAETFLTHCQKDE
ncbi:polyphosphate kinase 2 [Maritalea mobilis]|uniref:ADP/GDP-polyphosphate phosphotransferase n=1 Tax=Maritalea mobilis TaxID=483324 RepID=A0A4R6VMB3_9HYPH|nr:polyphosphate kinase 2 [Maritalea mobilis]TDQ64207.1 polyphosphate kinase 2 [Maritalea mobilis]